MINRNLFIFILGILVSLYLYFGLIFPTYAACGGSAQCTKETLVCPDWCQELSCCDYVPERGPDTACYVKYANTCEGNGAGCQNGYALSDDTCYFIQPPAPTATPVPPPPPTATPVPSCSRAVVDGPICANGSNFACANYKVYLYRQTDCTQQWECSGEYCGAAPTNTPAPGVPTNTPVPGVPTNTPVPPTPTPAQNITCSSSCTGTACNGGANNLVQNLCTDNNTGQVVSNIATCDTAQCANSTSPVCDSGFGVCGCSGNCRDGANTDYSCCHRSCANNTCTTVSGSGTQECNGEGSACGNTPPPATCPGNVCTCSGASAASCGECGGGWCNGGTCSTCSFTGDPPPTGNICDSETPSFSCAKNTVTSLTTQQVVTGIAKNSVVGGNYNGHTIQISPNEKLKINGHANSNASGLWIRNNNILKDANGNPISNCIESGTYTNSAGYNYCLNGTGKIISDQKDGNGNYKRPGGWENANDGDLVTPHNTYDQYLWSSDFSDYREYKGECTASGTISCCARRDNPDMSVDINGNRTKECYNPTEGDPCEIHIQPDACKYDDGDGAPLAPYTLSRDLKAVRTFPQSGTYILETSQTYQCGTNENNPCQIKVIVRNPNPPTGTIRTSDAQNRCIIPEKNSDGTPATTCDIDITWTTTDADTAKITYREGGTDFLPETTTQLSDTAAARVNAETRTFDLYGKSASFDTYYTSHGALATVAFHGNPYINGDVYVDTNEDGAQNNGETAWTGGGIVTINGTTNYLDPSGHYVRLDLVPNGNQTAYTISFTPPAGYESTTSQSVSVPLSAPFRQNFGIAPLHTVSGKVFNDQNKNKKFDGDDTAYTTTPMTIQATRADGTIVGMTATVNGNYTLSGLPSDRLNISLLTAVPTGFRVIWPVGSTPPTYTAQVGPACGSGPLDNTTGSSYINTQQCNVQDLNFAISNSIPWLQMMGSDGRFDTGTNNGQFTNFVANSLACNSGYTLLPGANSVPGIALIGSSSRDTAFGGVGVGSSNNWILGSPFPEYFTTFGSNPNATGQGLQTSYDYVLSAATTSNITPTNFTSITGCTDLNSCSIPPITTNGIFKADSSVVLNGATFGNGKNYILLINGDLTIKGNITVPTGSTATFAVKGDIIIDKTVGVSSFICPTTATSGQIQGFFSADKSIIIDSKDPSGAGTNCSDGTGADLQLNVDGSLVTNAGLSSGGFENRRDLCAYNITYPSLTLKERLDFMLNAPELLKTQNSIYREIAP